MKFFKHSFIGFLLSTTLFLAPSEATYFPDDEVVEDRPGVITRIGNALNATYEFMIEIGYMYDLWAAQRGNANAQFSLGLKYYYEEELQTATRYLALAADQRHAHALSVLGNMWGSGEGFEKNEKLGFHYLKMAADRGDPCAQDIVGHRYFYGIGGVDQNYANAFKYYKLAADQGYEYPQSIWQVFQAKLGSLNEDETGTTLHEVIVEIW